MTGNIDILEEILKEIFGESPWDDSARDTARRVLKMWQEFTPQQELDFTFTTFPLVSDQMVVVRDIEFSSLCSHHLCPFYGQAHIAYLPKSQQVGLSKIPRLVDYLARRPQMQETLTRDIADTLIRYLDPAGVAVVLEARHTCMACRGVRKQSASMTTSVMLGDFLREPIARSEFLTFIGRQSL